jgi:hypothetical protein
MTEIAMELEQKPKCSTHKHAIVYMACKNCITGSMLLTYKCSDPSPYTRDVVSVSFKNEIMVDKL